MAERNYDYIIITPGIYDDLVKYNKDLTQSICKEFRDMGGNTIVVDNEFIDNVFLSKKLWFTTGMNGNIIESNAKGTYQFNDIILFCDITAFWNYSSCLYYQENLDSKIDFFKSLMRFGKLRVASMLHSKDVTDGNVKNIIFRIGNDYFFDEESLEAKMREIIKINDIK